MASAEFKITVFTRNITGPKLFLHPLFWQFHWNKLRQGRRVRILLIMEARIPNYTKDHIIIFQEKDVIKDEWLRS